MVRRRLRWHLFRNMVSELGLFGSIQFAFLKSGMWRGAIHSLHARQAAYPLLVRSNSSDIYAFTQIFVHRQYAPLNELTGIELIVDLGANVGYSSAYFLTKFPHAEVIAVEPDPTNIALLKHNMTPYCDRVKIIHAGVWSHPARLTISDIPYRDGREWTRQVQEWQQGDIEGVDIPTLLNSAGHDRISLLKVDIEGAECVLFSGNYKSWIDKVDTIVIELHDDTAFGDASDIFSRAIKGLDFQISRGGELTICKSILKSSDADG
jgi:FkbM family methyltransferase